jgi:hypothetical protein
MKVVAIVAAVLGGICIGVAGHVIAAPHTQVAQGPTDCIPYNPADLKLTDLGPGGWMLERADGAKFRLFDNRADAETGLAVAKAHSSLCYIGRGNKRPNRYEYIMEIWK